MTLMATGSYTDVESCILSVLSDGEPHPRESLLACLCDSEGTFCAVRRHLSNIRKKLPANERIICQFWRRSLHYRHVIHLVAPAASHQQ